MILYNRFLERSSIMQVNRSNNLKIPKQIETRSSSINSLEDEISIKKAISTAHNEKFKERDLLDKEDSDLKNIINIPFNSNDLIVITVVKKLGAYIITITEKSPKKFRGVFVSRMQNYCLETIECLLNANFITMNSQSNKLKREEYQKEAIIKLKLLGYISMVAENSGCILKKQYKQISIQLAEAINLIVAWKKSDDKRWKNKN